MSEASLVPPMAAGPQPSAATLSGDTVQAHGVADALEGSESPPAPPSADDRRRPADAPAPSVDTVQVHGLVEAPEGMEFPSAPPSADDRQRPAATVTPPADSVQVHGLVEAPEGMEFPPAPPSADDRRRPDATVTPPAGAAEAPEEAERIHAPSAAEDKGPRREQVAAARHRTSAEKTVSARSDGHTEQSSLLVMVPVRAGQYEALLELLDKVANPDDGCDFEVNSIIPFAKIRTLHFARILLHQAPAPAKPLPAPAQGEARANGPAGQNMHFTTDFDGPLDEHIDNVLNEAGPGLDRVFGHCEGWPGSEDRAGVHGYFLRNRMASDSSCNGSMNRSVDQIHREQDLHQRVEAYLDREAGKPGFPAEALGVREKILDFVFGEPELAWTHRQPAGVPKPRFNSAYLKRVAVGFAAAMLAVLTAARNMMQEGPVDERLRARDGQMPSQVWYSQVPTQVWYSAYRWLSVDNINNNTEIRRGLYGDMSAADAGRWVRRFGGSNSAENAGTALARKAKNPTAPEVEMEYQSPALAMELLGAGTDYM